MHHTLVSINRRSYSTNNNYYSQFKIKRDLFFSDLVQNKKHQQEKLLCFHIIFVIGACLFFTRNLQILFLTLLFLFGLFILSLIINSVFEKIKSNFFYQLCATCITVIVFLVNENYYLCGF